MLRWRQSRVTRPCVIDQFSGSHCSSALNEYIVCVRVVGKPAHDLVRLALSLATAARDSDLLGVTVVKMMEQMVDGYEQALGPLKPK